MALTSAGSNITVAALSQECPATATGVVVAAGSLTGPAASCVGEAVVYQAFTTPPGYEDRLTWSGEGLSGSGAKRTNTYTTTGAKVVSVSCGTSVKSFTNSVYRMQITPTSQSALAGSPFPAVFTLTNSYGLASWQISPAGAAFANGNIGETVSVNPGSAGTNYALTACVVASPSCCGTALLQVVKVTFSTNSVAVCESNTVSLTVSVTPANMLGSLLFDTVTNVSGGASNTCASIYPGSGSTNLSVRGLAPGTATVRVRLGQSVAFGPVVKTIRVQFPTNAWYVAQGAAAYFGAMVTPAANADEVSYVSGNPTVAVVSGSGTNITAVGITNGTAQVQAVVGGQTCSSKTLTAVGVRLVPDEVILCVGQSSNVTALINPTSAPVTFTIDNANVASLVRTGNTLTVTSLGTGTARILSALNGEFVNSTPVRGLTVMLPTNELYVPEGSTGTFSVAAVPGMQGSNILFEISDPAIAAVRSLSPFPYLAVTGLTNGSTFLRVRVGTNQFCLFKRITVLPMQKLPLGRSLTGSGPSFFMVYVPTRWSGNLTITTTGGSITDLKSPRMKPFDNGTRTLPEPGWYTFCIPDSSSYVVSNSFVQSRTVTNKAPWTIEWYPFSDEQAPNLYDIEGCLAKYDTAFTKTSRAIEMRNRYVGGDYVATNTLCETNAELTVGYDFDNVDGDNNVWTGWGTNVVYDFWNGTPPAGGFTSVLGPDGDTADVVDASWWGHCDMATAVVICEKEPTGTNVVNGVVFDPELKKGLLVALYHDFEFDQIAGNNVVPHQWHRVMEERLLGEGAMFGCDVYYSTNDNQIWNYPIFAVSRVDYKEKPDQTNERTVEIRCEAKYWDFEEGEKPLSYRYCLTYANGSAAVSSVHDWYAPPVPSVHERPDSVWIPIPQTRVGTNWQGQLDYPTIRSMVPFP